MSVDHFYAIFEICEVDSVQFEPPMVNKALKFINAFYKNDRSSKSKYCKISDFLA